jgi:ParB family transcriptional regulator, chromosome partitioning protein
MSSLRDRMKIGASITLNADDEATAASMKSATPITGPGQTMQIAGLRKQLEEAKLKLTERDAEAEKRIKELEEQLAHASALEVPLSKLHEVPGRRRFMPPEKYAELRENLRHQELTQPVVVQIRADGEYEIVSGHHRTDAFRELGRETIRCVLKEGSSAEADDSAFFANLMQSDLTDYEKYIGLKRYQENHPELTQSEIAEHVGISQPHVSALLSFDRLPKDALVILELHKGILGARAVTELVSLTEAGKGASVVQAIQHVADQKLDQSQAVRFVREADKPKAVKPQAATFKVKTGKSTWCDVRRAKNVMRIEFHSEETAEAVHEAIREHLEKLAQAK